MRYPIFISSCWSNGSQFIYLILHSFRLFYLLKFFFSFYNTRMYDIPRLHDRRSGRSIRGQEESLIWKAVGHVSVCVSCWSSTTKDSICTFALSFSFSYISSLYNVCMYFCMSILWTTLKRSRPFSRCVRLVYRHRRFHIVMNKKRGKNWDSRYQYYYYLLIQSIR